MLITLTLCESQTWSTTNTLRYQLFTWLIFFFCIIELPLCYMFFLCMLFYVSFEKLQFNMKPIDSDSYVFSFFLSLLDIRWHESIINSFFFFFKQLKRKKSMFPIWYTVKMGKNYSLKTGCSESRCKPGCSESLLQLYMREEQRRKQRSIYDF